MIELRIRSRFATAMPLLTAVVLLSGVSVSARAENIVADSGFESADPSGSLGATDPFTSGSSIDGGTWNVTQGTVSVDTQNFYVYDGDKSVYLDGDGAGPGSLSQTLATVAGDTYTVSFWADADTANAFSLTLGGSAVTGVPDNITVNGFPSNSYLGNSSEFELYTGTVVASTSADDLVFTATNDAPGGSGVTVEIDDVSVVDTSATPEPSTFIMGGMGLGLLVWNRRRRFVR